MFPGSASALISSVEQRVTDLLQSGDPCSEPPGVDEKLYECLLFYAIFR